MQSKDISFSKELIKGKITEIIFEQMFRKSRQFTILHFGYEYTLPELAQYQDLLAKKGILDNIRHSPDFILISQDKTKVYFVEVKYRTDINEKEVLKIAKNLVDEGWRSPWLFMASPKGFFFEPCHTIIKNGGKIGVLYSTSIDTKTQTEYSNLLNEFMSSSKK
ncbi:MAG: hypothetical protein COU29_00395 [Candidatus Magasanikbacteria bacterium CG10_big_fil_rev_8_21_14_0_10_36_32]|uniref:Uncharacterized protein n=1 Tax=Candidatus Magasanikbacteria bacterium CG10_big_fil_rev_8_21_14_0_10_36_32 TaxID=1974646 RepID=A0A2M6W7W3_9BACT|nr:MAG: hypothetical protein COU29_00395 [Candidatus Magasanikbacteria bacterium CG10_big_fil_rev_8_21_14_0_10_36_32]